MNHTEGGWPKDINPADTEQTVRFKKKIEKDDMYVHSVHQLSHVSRYSCTFLLINCSFVIKPYTEVFLIIDI